LRDSYDEIVAKLIVILSHIVIIEVYHAPLSV